MSKILIDEATYKLALEALGMTIKGRIPPTGIVFSKATAAYTALREALAEQPARCAPAEDGVCESLDCPNHKPAQQEPEKSDIFCGVDFADGMLSVSVLRRRANDVAELLHAEQIEFPAQQEPVAFYRCNGCGHAYEQVHPTSCDCMEGSSFEQVNYYTSPPAQRKPLTNEQFQAICNRLSRQVGWDGDGWDLALKEAIEAAHNIKENT